MQTANMFYFGFRYLPVCWKLNDGQRCRIQTNMSGKHFHNFGDSNIIKIEELVDSSESNGSNHKIFAKSQLKKKNRF